MDLIIRNELKKDGQNETNGKETEKRCFTQSV